MVLSRGGSTVLNPLKIGYKPVPGVDEALLSGIRGVLNRLRRVVRPQLVPSRKLRAIILRTCHNFLAESVLKWMDV